MRKEGIPGEEERVEGQDKLPTDVELAAKGRRSRDIADVFEGREGLPAVSARIENGADEGLSAGFVQGDIRRGIPDRVVGDPNTSDAEVDVVKVAANADRDRAPEQC